MTAEKARELVANAKFILLDFDGPVTPLMPSPLNVMCYEQALAALRQYSDVPTKVDHLDVLRKAEEISPACIKAVEEASISAEMECASKSELTDGTREFITETSKRIPIAIVSNNARQPIEYVLAREGLSQHIATIEGRPFGQPSKMKPTPFMPQAAAHTLGLSTSQGVFIGDTEPDIQVAAVVEMPVIAYAANEQKRQRLVGADAIVTSMHDLLARVV